MTISPPDPNNLLALFNAERQRAQQLAVMNEISRLVIASSYHIDSMWNGIYNQIIKLFDVSTFYALGYDEKLDTMRFIWLVEDGAIGDIPLPMPVEGLSGIVIRTGKPVLVKDVPAELDALREKGSLPIPMHEEIETHPTRSWLGVPLRSRDDSLLGMIAVQSYQPFAYDQDDTELLVTIATQIALAMENARLFSAVEASAAQLVERARRLESLHQVSTLLSSSLDRNVILSRAAEQIVKLMNVDHCSIAVIDSEVNLKFDSEKHQATIVAEYPVSGVTGKIIPTPNHPIFDPHQLDVFIYYNSDPSHRLAEFSPFIGEKSVRSLLAIRMAAKDRVIGAITLDTASRRREFAIEEIETFRTLALQVTLAVENATLYSQALAANELKSQFLATMSHELRTPLNAVIGYTEMLLGGIYGEFNEKQQDRLNRVVFNAQHLLALINDVLDLAKIESGRMKLNLEPLPLGPIIEDASNNVLPQAEVKQLDFVTEIPSGLPTVMTDNVRLRQILVNLLSNAIKFTRQGKVSLSAHAITLTQPDDHLPVGQWIIISVKDTGIGIKKENFELIFDAFRQVDGATNRQYEGTGLGLAITRQLIELHGGKIWVDSEIGVGSTFTFGIPVASEEMATSA